MLANYSESKILLGGNLITVETGEFYTSEEKLSERWGISRKTTDKFLKILESEGMIELRKSRSFGTSVKVLNYGIYQGKETTEEQQKNIKRTTEEQQKHIKGTTEEQQKHISKKNKIKINKNKIKINKIAAADARAGEDVPTTSPEAEPGEDVPTTSPIAEPGEDVPTTSPIAEPGEDVPTTSPEAEVAVERALKLMENLYFKYTGRMVNSMDLVCMQEIAELTADEKLIGETMKLTKQKYMPKFSGDKIKSFKYFTFALKEAAEKERVRKNAVCAGGIAENVSNGKSFKNRGVLGQISEEEFNRRLGKL